MKVLQNVLAGAVLVAVTASIAGTLFGTVIAMAYLTAGVAVNLPTCVAGGILMGCWIAGYCAGHAAE